jgi:protein-tyrosine phosphatase
LSRPFTVLNVCMGNICRSPMAERLLVARLEDALGPVAGELIDVRGAGTSGWHEGEPMDRGAAREVLARGGRTSGFAATALIAEAVTGQSAADLVLTATIDQVEIVTELGMEVSTTAGPDLLRDRTFVLGEFARFAVAVDEDALPPSAPTVDGIAARGRALVTAAAALRTADGRPPRYADQVPDPWGRGQEYFGAVADQVDDAVMVLAARLVGPEHSSLTW